MDGEINLLTLLSLVVAVVAIIKLRSLLGRRTEEDETRIDRKREAMSKQVAGAQSDKVVALPQRGRQPEPAETTVSVAEVEERIKAFAGADTQLATRLMDILRLDSKFEPDTFLRGAKQAYEMIVTAFAEGNRRVLRDLLSADVLDSFSRAISEREQQNLVIDQSFVGINKADILEAEVSSKGVASITVRFVSQLISATRDKSGEIIEGDDSRVKDVTDIWTFSRDISTKEARRNLNWKLVGTQSPN
ncbi:Tim44/TimA family putative adaptor protein [Hyphomicrobium sp.]|uniref:Tim44/TimA family putative adaptor protein n=1 Tax=Hyphomicrobium sp. TaxID=82 RepID=UPI002C0318C0|nr:Tim44/TimA family putative adaptor protein [Hyphomicrobium sp.]HRN88121.1 Tim44/TimA family putative adaptor protein [Hyphomicrobium sp.]HRQ28210.1 Tim44/TimA family putative adaptor protein [Hyphomicrobium sp.]